ncbi:Hypothetical protein NGAL_HAMBI2605_45910 [Neorhizobium galegae bv. orientalis]|nr:Hypothetical protein NGAL_HAMBI2605_45910 [Neorhizobium galegae bv. orientalis]
MHGKPLIQIIRVIDNDLADLNVRWASPCEAHLFESGGSEAGIITCLLSAKLWALRNYSSGCIGHVVSFRIARHRVWLKETMADLAMIVGR